MRVVRVSGCVGAQDPQPVGQQLARTRRRRPPVCPDLPSQCARLLRVVRVSGGSGPRTRSLVGRAVASNAVAAAAGSPGLPAQAGEVAAGGQGVGVVGAQDPHPVGPAAAANAVDGAAGSPASPPPGRARSLRVVRVSGCVGAQHPQLVGRAVARTVRGRRRRIARLAPSEWRGCCGWSGCRGGRGPAPAAWSASSCLERGRRPPAGSPGIAPASTARLLRVVRVSGWSGPRTRTRSASSCSNAVDGGGRVCPDSARQCGEVVAGGQGVGVRRGPGPAPGRPAAAGTLRPRPPPARTLRGRRRGCCGWSGCRGHRDPGPAPGRPAAAGTLRPRPPPARTPRATTRVARVPDTMSAWSPSGTPHTGNRSRRKQPLRSGTDQPRPRPQANGPGPERACSRSDR